jgi:uracil-DNA glycosylase
MGATAHRWFGGRSSSLSAVRGERFDIVRPLLVEGARPLAIPAVSTWHPAYILRLRAERRREAEDEFVADFRLAAELAGEWL